MPELFPSVLLFLLSGLIVAGSQLIYATVGFGAGMFSIALLAMLLPDLAAAVATLFLLTFLTEAWVLLRSWRLARVKLLLSLLPTAAIGLWLGSELLAAGSTPSLKRWLGVVVAAAGGWFLFAWNRRGSETTPQTGSPDTGARPVKLGRLTWLSLPAGFAAGTLAGLYGTGGPPVIILLQSFRLDKGTFRATLLWFFLLMSILRGASYLRIGLLTLDELMAAIWLLPFSVAGMLLGMVMHHRISERQFRSAVSVLLVILGILLAVIGGR
jgi:uncharacterized membrane protein YfcA